MTISRVEDGEPNLYSFKTFVKENIYLKDGEMKDRLDKLITSCDIQILGFQSQLYELDCKVNILKEKIVAFANKNISTSIIIYKNFLSSAGIIKS